MPPGINRKRRRCIPIQDIKVGYTIRREFNDGMFYTGEVIQEARTAFWNDDNPQKIRCTVRYHWDDQLEHLDERQLNLWAYTGPLDQSQKDFAKQEKAKAAKKKKEVRVQKKKKRDARNRHLQHEASKAAADEEQIAMEAYHRSVLVENERYESKKRARKKDSPTQKKMTQESNEGKQNPRRESQETRNSIVSKGSKATGGPKESGIARERHHAEDTSNQAESPVPDFIDLLDLDSLRKEDAADHESRQNRIPQEPVRSPVIDPNAATHTTGCNDNNVGHSRTVDAISSTIEDETPESQKQDDPKGSSNPEMNMDAFKGLLSSSDSDSQSESSMEESISDFESNRREKEGYMLSKYELKREKAIERNRRRILQLGLVDKTTNDSNSRCVSSSSPTYRYEHGDGNNTIDANNSLMKETLANNDNNESEDQEGWFSQQHFRRDTQSNDENLLDKTGPSADENGYYEVDEILDRRMRKINQGGGNREVVEYQIKWKGYSSSQNGWEIAEHLNPKILAYAHLKFPTAFDPDRLKIESQQKTPAELVDRMVKESQGEDNEENDISSSSEEEESEDESEDLVSIDDSDDVDQSISTDDDDDDDDDDNYRTKILHESKYDKVGTVELVLNRKCYRVGQSFGSKNKKIIFRISKLIPKDLKAICDIYMLFDETFSCPKGCGGTYLQLDEQSIVDLETLKKPCRDVIEEFPLVYHENDNQRSFYYRNKEGSVKNHCPLDKPTVLDLYAGVGGMSIGFENAGFEVKWAVENTPIVAATYLANANLRGSNETQLYQEDVKRFLKRSEQRHPSYPSPDKHEVHHIHASTPCKGFSRANRYGGKDDVRNNKQTVLFIKAIKLFQPMTATFENVPGLVLKDYRRYLQYMVSSLLSMEYQVRVSVLNASSYGDPQNRHRVILWAARKDCKLPSIPPETHGDPSRDDLLPVKTCKTAIQYLEKYQPSIGSKSSGAVSMNGCTILNHVCPRLPRKARDSTDRKSDNFVLQEDHPSRTILARARPHIHYNNERFISVREAASLQSFPASFQFFGTTANQLSQVGNAVPICLATAVARSVAKVHGLP